MPRPLHVKKLGKEKVKVIRPLMVPATDQKGRYYMNPLTDKQGTWVQVEMMSGAEKGCRRPVTLESLKFLWLN